MSIRGEIEEQREARKKASLDLERAERDYDAGYLTAKGYNHYLSKVYPEWSDDYKELKKDHDSDWDPFE